MEVNLTQERIMDLVNQRGLSKAEFAQKIGVERKNLEIYLKAKKKDVNLVIRMAEALNMSLYDFVGLDDPAKEVYGCLYVKGLPVLVNSKKDIEAVLDRLSNR